MLRAMNDLAAINGIPAALRSATSAVGRSGRALEKDANVVARTSGIETRETVDALVDSRQQVLYTQAAGKLIEASDEILQSLIDIRA
jgi:hypothetical protein